MAARFRDRNEDPIVDFASNSASQVQRTYVLDVRWLIGQNVVPYAPYRGTIESDFGGAVTPPLPPVVLNQHNQAYLDANDSSWQASFIAFLSNAWDPRVFELISDFSSRVPFTKYRLRDEMVDSTNPGYLQRLGKQFVGNSMNIFRETWTSDPQPAGDYDLQVSIGNMLITTTQLRVEVVCIVSLPGYDGIPQNIEQAIIKSLDELSNYQGSRQSRFNEAYLKTEQASFETLVALGELPDTVKTVVKHLYNLRDILRDIKRGNIPALRRRFNISFRDLQDFWLEVRYAIRPIIIDVEKLIHTLNNNPDLGLKRFGSRRSEEDSFESSPLSNYTYKNKDYTVDMSVQRKVCVSAAVFGKAHMSDLSGALRSWGLTNIGITAWELIPFTFIVDWFVDVSGWIAHLNPNPVFYIEGGYHSVCIDEIVTGTVTVIDLQQNETVVPFSVTRKLYDRTLQKAPTLSIQIDLNLDLPKLLDLVAIFGRK